MTSRVNLPGLLHSRMVFTAEIPGEISYDDPVSKGPFRYFPFIFFFFPKVSLNRSAIFVFQIDEDMKRCLPLRRRARVASFRGTALCILAERLKYS